MFRKLLRIMPKEPRVFRVPQKMFLTYARFRRGMTLGVRAACFDEGGRIFLIRHTYVRGWYLPGGGVEPGETMEQSLERELMEEGGIRLDAPAPLFGMYLNRHVSRRDHVGLYVAREWTLAAPPKVPNMEIAEVGFFAPAGLPDGTTEGTRRRLAEIAGTAPRSAEW
jgi:8-oxo-dGTP pyrophosphatase MutT (NUDIX family)